MIALTFKVKDTAKEGIGCINAEITNCYDDNMDSIDIEDASGKVSIVNYIPGDINNDMVVDLKDVTTIRRYLAGGYGIELK